MACPEGSCEAYRDIFTSGRWRAQGFAVRKGEAAVVVNSFVSDRTQRSKRSPKASRLYCRHQVHAITRNT